LFGGYGLALAALALVVFGAYDSYPSSKTDRPVISRPKASIFLIAQAGISLGYFSGEVTWW